MFGRRLSFSSCVYSRNRQKPSDRFIKIKKGSKKGKMFWKMMLRC
jgi:hypothetical protein